ncbi:MAG: T9SS type A sorting domain-containing protein [Clostridia bacterium]|nr:T9SS type A sorting domain-containing protein [Clostridia bacterium]
MKVKTTILMLVLVTVLNGLIVGQSTSSATYTAGDIAVDAGFYLASQSSTCPGVLTVNIPSGAAVTGVDVVYDFEAIPASGAYKSYQLSELRCVSPGGLHEGVLASFPNDWTTGVLTYQRSGLTIANGVAGGGDIIFELHAGTSQGGQPGCSTNKLKINNGTWTVTVQYSDPSYPSLPLNPNPQDGTEAVSISVGSLSWDFGDNTDAYDLYFGTNNPPTTKVVDNEISGVSGSYVLETLSGSNNYYWQLVVRNAANNELAGPVWSFSTECLPAATPIFVDFDNLNVPQWDPPHFINPTCWTLLYQCSEAYANQGAYNSTHAFSAPNCWMMANEGDGNAWSMMIMPEMEDDLNTLQLSFVAKVNYSIHPLYIGTMTDPNNAATYTEFTTVTPTYNQFTEIEVSFSSYQGTDKYMVVRYQALNPNTWEYTYIDNVLIGAIPTCQKPKELAAIEVTPNTATVTWFEQGEATQWNIEVVLAGEDPTGIPTAVVNTNPFTLEGLEAATLYDFYVQSDCGGGDVSFWSAQGTFLTACMPEEAPIFENFDASTALPACWQQATAGNGTAVMQTYSAYSAPNTFKLSTSIAGDVSMLISPPLTITNGSLADIQLNFFAKRTATVANLVIGTISNPLDYTSFTPISTVDMPTSNTWNEYEVWFNNYTGDDIYIAIKVGTLSLASQITLDDINIGLLPGCLNPIGLWVSEITETDARLNFTESGSATTWGIEIGSSGFEPGTGAEIQSYTYEFAGDYSFVMTGLESGTFYDVYMYADCGGGDVSLWSPVAQFMSQLELFSPLPLIEPFDPDFTYSGNPPTNQLDWTLNNALYHSAPNSAYNHYAGISNNVLLISKRFDLTDRANVFLSFWHIAKTDGNKDHCYVEISTDGGITFDQIAASAYFGTGNYYEATANFPEGPAFDEDSYPDWGTTNSTPDNTWWKNETFDLSGYSGSDNVVIRFRLSADQFTNRYGWLIDDVTIGTYTGVETNANPLSFDVEVEAGGSTSETLTISNNGDFPILYTANVTNYIDAVTTLVSEDFETGLPADWTVLNEGTSSGSMWHWEEMATAPSNLNGTNYMYVNRSHPDTCNETLISPAFDGTGFSNVFLSWDNLWAMGSSSKPDFAEVSVWDGNQWQSLIFMKTINIGSWGSPDQTVYDITQWANPEMKVRFHYEGVSYSKTAMDNFLVTASDIPLNWLTLDGETSISGLIQGGEFRIVEVGFTARPSFPFGKWNAEIEIVSSDPVNPYINIPVSMTIGHSQNYTFTQGWNSMSTYLQPTDPAVENMFAPVVNELTLLRNLSSLYWPAQAVNTIGNWDNNSGYVLKVTEDFSFEILGEDYATSEVSIPAGWSYLPVISPCAVNIMEMFGDNLDDVIIIQELIGSSVFWPAAQIYALQTLEPGKAYNIKLANPMLVSFPQCNSKTQTALTTQSNSIQTDWGTIDLSPVSQVTLFMAEALGSFADGDVIGAFDQEGKIYGHFPVSGKNENYAMTIFGDDGLSATGNGFMDNEPVSYKLLRASTGEKFNLEVTYSPLLENTSGNFVAGSFAAISDLKLSATGIEGLSANAVGFYPNPASQTLNITGIDGNAQVSIFNVFGVEVLSTQIASPSGIDLRPLSKGTYLVKITNDKGQFVDKLIIQ